MAALKFRFLAPFLLASCAHTSVTPNIYLDNQVSGCFNVDKSVISSLGSITTAQISVSIPEDFDCPCKSALLNYTAKQNYEGHTSLLLAGSFTAIGKQSITLPVAVEKKLIFKDIPIVLSFNCAGP